MEKASTRGRPRKVSDQSVQKLIRTLNDMQSRNVNITMKNVVEKSGLSLEMTIISTRKAIATCKPVKRAC